MMELELKALIVLEIWFTLLMTFFEKILEFGVRYANLAR